MEMVMVMVMKCLRHHYWFWFVIGLYVLVVFVVKVSDYLWWRPRRIEQHFSRQGIRGPTYHFFIGSLKELVGLSLKASSQPMSRSHNILPRVLSFYHHWKKIYGSTFLVWFGPMARLTISDPALIREIFVLKSELFEKTEPPPLVRKIEGDGLLSLTGEKWAHHRKIITPAFHLGNLKLKIPMMGESMNKMLDRWSAMASSSGGGGRVEIEVSECFQTLAEEAITLAAFGSSYEGGRVVFGLQAQQMAYASEAFQKVFIPGYRFLPTRKNRIFWRLERQIRKSLMELIRQRRLRNYYSSCCEELGSNKDQCPNDILELMLRASFNNDDNTMITAHDIVQECKTVFFAGKHTTVNLMTWTTILLAMHPHWQELARDEVFRLCGARDVPTSDSISKLNTLGMILNESLRLYPPAVAAIRRARVDVELGSLSIPKGTELLIPILAVHHDSGLWGEDASEFNPQRFAKGVAHAAKHPMAYMPFGLGARRCIGQNLAILQAKLAIAMILQRFTFQLSPSYRHAPTALMLLDPQYGAPIIFHKL